MFIFDESVCLMYPSVLTVKLAIASLTHPCSVTFDEGLYDEPNAVKRFVDVLTVDVAFPIPPDRYTTFPCFRTRS